MRSDILTRLVVCAAIALVAASDPVIHVLRGHGWWIVAAAIVLSTPIGILTERGFVKTAFTQRIFQICGILLGVAIQADSGGEMNLGLPYALRVVAFTCMLVIFSWLGEKMCMLFTPETEEERARP
jgi:hypothetical protein